jgi:hypothetical protein
MGLWLARQLCDQIEMVRIPDGFMVRLTTAISDRVAGHRADTAPAQFRAAAAQVRAARARTRASEALDRFTRQ